MKGILEIIIKNKIKLLVGFVFVALITCILIPSSPAYATTNIAVKQTRLWVNQTNTHGYSWGVIGIVNNQTSSISVNSILVNGTAIPYSNWYADTNKTELTSANFNWPYMVTSMYSNGSLKDSTTLSPNACSASYGKLRIDFDGAGINPALCLTKQNRQVSLLPGQSMIVYFRVPNGIILPSYIGTSTSVNIITSIGSITQNAIIKNLNDFNLRFFLQTDQAYYWTELRIFEKYLKGGDYLLIGNTFGTVPSNTLNPAQYAKTLFKPGVHVLSYRVYRSIGYILSEVPKLPAGFDYIFYDYEVTQNPEFTTNMTQSLIYFDEANTAINQYNKNTDSHAKLMTAISYPPIRWSKLPWDWGVVASHMSHIMVEMSGYFAYPGLPYFSSSSISQIREKSPSTVNEIHLSMSTVLNRATPQQLVNALYVMQGVGANDTLVFYNNNQTSELRSLFNLLVY